jgi:uncharacterized phage-associated protein
MSLAKVDSKELANYILAKVGSMTHLKLQKLVYYAEAYHLAYFEKSIIDDHFEAWLHGPVSRKLWDHIKGVANVYDSIMCPGDKNVLIKNFKNKVTKDQLELINDVLKEYGQESSYALECMTHAEDPWRNAREGYAPGDKCEKIIDKKLMKRYYKQNLYQ